MKPPDYEHVDARKGFLGCTAPALSSRLWGWEGLRLPVPSRCQQHWVFTSQECDSELMVSSVVQFIQSPRLFPFSALCSFAVPG